MHIWGGGWVGYGELDTPKIDRRVVEPVSGIKLEGTVLGRVRTWHLLGIL